MGKNWLNLKFFSILLFTIEKDWTPEKALFGKEKSIQCHGIQNTQIIRNGVTTHNRSISQGKKEFHPQMTQK